MGMESSNNRVRTLHLGPKAACLNPLSSAFMTYGFLLPFARRGRYSDLKETTLGLPWWIGWLGIRLPM